MALLNGAAAAGNGASHPPGNNGANGVSPIQVTEAVLAQIRPLLHDGESVCVAVETDMALTGQFDTAWLVGTDGGIAVFAQNGKGLARKISLPWDQTLGLYQRDGLGTGMLEARTLDGSIPLVRYTQARADRIEAAIDRLKEMLPEPQEEEEEKYGGESAERARRQKAVPCPKCGNPMPRWMQVCPDCVDKRELLGRLVDQSKRYWKPILVTFLLTAALRACVIYPAGLQQKLFDEALNLKVGQPLAVHYDQLWWILGILAAVHIGKAFIGGAQIRMMTWVGEKVTNDLRTDIYTHLQKLGVSYYDQKETGWIMDRVTGDTATLQTFMTETLQRTVLNVMTLFVIAAWMYSSHPVLATVALLPAPFVCMMTAGFMKKTHRIWHWAWRRRSRMFALLSNVLPGVRVVKAFVQEGREYDRFEKQSRDYMDARVDASQWFSKFHVSTSLVMSLSTLMIWGYGGWLVLQNPTGDPKAGVTVGMLVMFIALVAQFYSPLQELTTMSQQIQQAATSGQRVFEVLDTQPEMTDQPDAIKLDRIEGKVEFRNVSFGYEERRPVLRNVSFTVPAGEMVGIVGPSGAGKSTTVNLICRFYDATSGQVLIDDHDVRDVRLGDLRRQIGIVLQEPFLFHGTIAENIAYGLPDSPMEDIMRAAKAANAHDFILRFPDAYDTMVGERGARLSGGERQRISIARAILKNPRILILDEATSSVDTETEALIREAIDHLISGRTTFAIAHRLSTLQHANQLLVLEKGRLAEHGTHAELLSKKDGVFRRLVDVQNELAAVIEVGG